jgi:hypothetical protein
MDCKTRLLPRKHRDPARHAMRDALRQTPVRTLAGPKPREVVAALGVEIGASHFGRDRLGLASITQRRLRSAAWGARAIGSEPVESASPRGSRGVGCPRLSLPVGLLGFSRRDRYPQSYDCEHPDQAVAHRLPPCLQSPGASNHQGGFRWLRTAGVPPASPEQLVMPPCGTRRS